MSFWVRLHQDPSIIEPHPLSLLVYQIADSLVDDYFPIVDRFDDRLADLEELLFDSPGRFALPRLFVMRKSLIAMRRLTNQMRDVFNILSRREQIVFNENTCPITRTCTITCCASRTPWSFSAICSQAQSRRTCLSSPTSSTSPSASSRPSPSS